MSLRLQHLKSERGFEKLFIKRWLSKDKYLQNRQLKHKKYEHTPLQHHKVSSFYANNSSMAYHEPQQDIQHKNLLGNESSHVVSKSNFMNTGGRNFSIQGGSGQVNM